MKCTMRTHRAENDLVPDGEPRARLSEKKEGHMEV